MTARATILSRAFARIGIASYEFDVSPDEREAARVMLDAMMAEWLEAGVDLAYTPSDGYNDAEDMTTPAWADSAVWSNLAMRLAPEFGKSALPVLARDAKRGYDLCVTRTLKVPVDQRATRRIYGSGDRYYRRYGW